MKTLRKKLKSISFLMSFIILFASCNYYDDNSGVDNSISEFTGKDLYKSIFFAYGDFAKNINSYSSNVDNLNKLSLNQKEDIKNDLDDLVKSIETTNPSFFEDFKIAILSKNHRLIDEAIRKGGEELHKNLKIMYPNFDIVVEKINTDYKSGKITTNGKIDQKKMEENTDEYLDLLNENMITSKSKMLSPCSWALACVFYFVLAAHNQVAVVFNIVIVATIAVAVAIVVKIKAVKRASNNKEDPLAFEILVNDIATI